MRRIIDTGPSSALLRQRRFGLQRRGPAHAQFGEEVTDLVGQAVALDFRPHQDQRRVRRADQPDDGGRELLFVARGRPVEVESS